MSTATKSELIEQRIDKGTAGSLSVSSAKGGMDFSDMSQVMEFAKLMAVSQQAVPSHCRNQPGICLGITIQAIEWRMSPYAVASKSYVVNDRLSYESQLIHAVIEQRAPIVSRLRHEYHGSGDKRTCRVWATPKGEDDPVEYTSPEIGNITPKNSPLWKTKPDLQLYYNASSDWARMYFPDVLLGVYASDELDEEDIRQPSKRAKVSTLNEAIERPQIAASTVEEVAEVIPVEEPDPFDPNAAEGWWEAATEELGHCSTLGACDKAYHSHESDAERYSLPDQWSEAVERRKGEIRAARGGKQGELIDKGQPDSE